MSLNKIPPTVLTPVFARFLRRLKFSRAFLLVAIAFVFNLFIPDLVPFADEIIMGLATALLASIKKDPEPEAEVDKESNENSQ